MKRQSAVLFAILLTLLPVMYGRPAATPVARAAGGLPTGSFSLGTRQSGEVVGLRSRYSRTYAQDGHYVAQVSPDSVNYQDAAGNWQPIDDTLVSSSRSGYAWQNKANSYTASFPADIGAAPIRIETSKGWASFSLTGATGAGTVSGNSISYSISGATVTYAATGDSLKESITLQGASSPSTFVYTVSTSAGLSLQQNAGGGIDVVDPSSKVQFSLPHASMQDKAGASSDAVSMTLGQAGGATTVTITPSPAWLADPARQWPVVVDPTVQFNGASQDCYLDLLYPTSKFCAGLDLKVDKYRHSLLQFYLGSIPANSEVLSADLGLYLTGNSVFAGSTAVSLYQVTQSWNIQATWNLADGIYPWTMAGGTINPTAAATNPSVGWPTNAWYHWYPTQLVQGWVNHTLPNDGLLLKNPTDTVSELLTFNASQVSSNKPYLTVTYVPQTGQQPFYTMAGAGGVGVNLANGNLVAGQGDVAMAGVGVPLSVSRTYNHQSPVSSDLGNSWTMDAGRDVGLQIFADGSAAFDGPSGFQIPFTKNSDGSFTSPSGIDAKLVKNGDGTYTLTFNASGEQYTFTSGGFLTAQKDKSGNTVSFGYGAGNLLTSITDTQGRTTSLTYNASNLITQVTDPASRTYQYAYDASKNLTSSTDPAGKVTQFAYSAGNLNQVTDPDGNVSKVSYDGSNRVSSIIQVTNPSAGTGPTTTFTYNASSTTVTDPNNHTTTYNYDAYGRPTSVNDALNHTTQVTWNADNKPTQVKAPSGAATSYTYDGNNNLTQVTAPTGATQKAQYTNTSFPYLPTSVTDAQGNTSTIQYSTQGLPTSVTNALNKTASVTYNSNGTIATQTDQNGNVTSVSYGTNGLPSQVTPPNPLGSQSTTYTTANQVATQTDGKGQKATPSYDAAGQVTAVAYQNADGTTGPSIGYAYDNSGNLLSMADPTGTTSYTYDVLNRVTSKTLPSGPYLGDGHSVDYTYDSAGNLATKIDSGGTVSYTYTAANQIASVTDPQNKVTTFSYDQDGHRTQIAYPNGVTESMSYNTTGQLTNISEAKSGATIYSFAYSYTNPTNNQPTALTYSATDVSGNVTTNSFDAANRLVHALQKNSGGATLNDWQYAYDAVGNMTSKTVNGTTTTLTYNAANELTAAGGTTYTSDPNGARTGSSAGESSSYNAAQQRTSLTPAGESPLAQIFTGIGQSELTQSGSNGYRYDATGMSSMTANSSTTYYTRAPDGTLISERTSTGTYYYGNDKASVVNLTDGNGSTQNSYSYDPSGKTTSCTEGVQNSITFGDAVTITGSCDQLSPWLYLPNYQRYYDPSTAPPGPGTCPQGQLYEGGTASCVFPVDPQDSLGGLLRSMLLTRGAGGACSYDVHAYNHGWWIQIYMNYCLINTIYGIAFGGGTAIDIADLAAYVATKIPFFVPVAVVSSLLAGYALWLNTDVNHCNRPQQSGADLNVPTIDFIPIPLVPKAPPWVYPECG